MVSLTSFSAYEATSNERIVIKIAIAAITLTATDNTSFEPMLKI